MKFKNPQNGFTEETNKSWLWALLFGCFYFAKHGVWPHVFISFFLAVFTGGISWLIYPFFTKDIIRKCYLKKGWIEIGNKVNGENFDLSSTVSSKPGEFLKP